MCRGCLRARSLQSSLPSGPFAPPGPAQRWARTPAHLHGLHCVERVPGLAVLLGGSVVQEACRLQRLFCRLIGVLQGQWVRGMPCVFRSVWMWMPLGFHSGNRSGKALGHDVMQRAAARRLWAACSARGHADREWLLGGLPPYCCTWSTNRGREQNRASARTAAGGGSSGTAPAPPSANAPSLSVSKVDRRSAGARGTSSPTTVGCNGRSRRRHPRLWKGAGGDSAGMAPGSVTAATG